MKIADISRSRGLVEPVAGIRQKPTRKRLVVDAVQSAQAVGKMLPRNPDQNQQERSEFAHHGDTGH